MQRLYQIHNSRRIAAGECRCVKETETRNENDRRAIGDERDVEDATHVIADLRHRQRLAPQTLTDALQCKCSNADVVIERELEQAIPQSRPKAVRAVNVRELTDEVAEAVPGALRETRPPEEKQCGMPEI
jgi:hypothetical protein